MAKAVVKVRVQSVVVVRESDGRTLLLASVHAGQRLLSIQVIEGGDDAD